MRKRKEESGGLTRRDFLYLSGAGMAGMTLAGIPELGHGTEKKPKYGGRMRVGWPWGSRGLDVHKNQDFADYMNYCLMYNGLTEGGVLPHVEFFPSLAKSWEIFPDGKEYVFALREKVKFHHGKELDSEDVKYSLDRVMNPQTRAPRAFSFKWVDSIETVDKVHVKIKLKEPFTPFITALNPYNCCIIPKGVEPTASKPAPGTGPFVFKSFIANETIEVGRFKDYWEYDEKTGNRLPYLDTVYMKKIVDETVRYTALRAGDLDCIYGPPLKTLSDVAMKRETVPGIKMHYDYIASGWIVFNTTKPPFHNKKVRQAIAYAIDKEELVKAIYWDLGKYLNNQPFSEGVRFCISIQDRKRNLERAKQLLAEAGYPNGFETEFLQYSFYFHLKGAEYVISELKKIGIKAKMAVLDRAPFFSRMRKGEFNIWFGSQDQRFDWDDAFYVNYHSREIGKNNWSRYSNKELDALLEKGRITLGLEQRRPIYKRVVETLAEDLPAWYHYIGVVGTALRDHVKGFRDGFALRPGWHGGGFIFMWVDK